MSKYKKGNKVVLRKDLEVGKRYGNNGWVSKMEDMKELPYVILGQESSGGGGFPAVNYIGDYRITPEMIEGMYGELASKPTPEIPDHLIEQIEYTPTYPELFSESTTRELLINAALDSGDKELFMRLTGGL